MAAFFSNMVFVWWVKQLRRLDENPIIKWWVESDFPRDYLAFLDDGPYFNGARVSEKEVLLAWMSIGRVQNGIEKIENFMMTYNNEYPKVPRKVKIIDYVLIPFMFVGLLYLFVMIDDDGISPFAYLYPMIAATVFASFDYHNLYYRLMHGRILPKWSQLKLYFLILLISFGMMFGMLPILWYLGLGPSYLDLSSYSIIIRMLVNAGVFVGTVVGLLAIFEIYLRASLRLIRAKMGM
jgi:hypothetical protein